MISNSPVEQEFLQRLQRYSDDGTFDVLAVDVQQYVPSDSIQGEPGEWAVNGTKYIY